MAVAALNRQALGHGLANYWLLLLSIDLAMFYDVSSTIGRYLSPVRGLTSYYAFFTPLPWPPTTPINHPYVSTCDIDEKLSKMVGNSVSYSLKSS